MNKAVLDIIKEIINIGLAKSADSLSFFTQSKVIFSGYKLEVKKTEAVDEFSQKKGSKIYVLTTDIIGDLEGVCYLLFSEGEVKELMGKNLPPSMLEDEEQFNQLSKEMLLELDNIVTASVVTQFSNFLNQKAIGGVPRLDILNEKETQDLMTENMLDYESCISFKTNLEVDSMNLSPEFVWALGGGFVKSAEKIILTNDS